MKSKFSIVGMLAIAVIGLSAMLIQAEFIQCPGGVCNFGTINNDVINGSPLDDDILGNAGHDIIFGNAGDDLLQGDPGNDIIFGGIDSDTLVGFDGDDLLFPGPDRLGVGQWVNGTGGNDTVTVFVGEVSECLAIFNAIGSVDVVNLIGFGPYVATKPFGIPGFDQGWIHVVDPIAGGDIFIHILEGNASGTEVINGLLSPNVTFLVGATPPEVLACVGTFVNGNP